MNTPNAIRRALPFADVRDAYEDARELLSGCDAGDAIIAIRRDASISHAAPPPRAARIENEEW